MSPSSECLLKYSKILMAFLTCSLLDCEETSPTSTQGKEDELVSSLLRIPYFQSENRNASLVPLSAPCRNPWDSSLTMSPWEFSTPPWRILLNFFRILSMSVLCPTKVTSYDMFCLTFSPRYNFSFVSKLVWTSPLINSSRIFLDDDAEVPSSTWTPRISLFLPWVHRKQHSNWSRSTIPDSETPRLVSVFQALGACVILHNVLNKRHLFGSRFTPETVLHTRFLRSGNMSMHWLCPIFQQHFARGCHCDYEHNRCSCRSSGRALVVVCAFSHVGSIYDSSCLVLIVFLCLWWLRRSFVVPRPVILDTPLLVKEYAHRLASKQHGLRHQRSDHPYNDLVFSIVVPVVDFIPSFQSLTSSPRRLWSFLHSYCITNIILLKGTFWCIVDGNARRRSSFCSDRRCCFFPSFFVSNPFRIIFVVTHDNVFRFIRIRDSSAGTPLF